jgi:glycosyltransferase involved in cell wall biosynthesis
MIDINQLYGPLNNILLVGTYPPPLGGISVFIYRLKKLLERNSYKVTVYNTASKSRIWGFKFIRFLITLLQGNYQIIHLQHFDLKKILVLLFFRRFKNFKIYFTDHNPFHFDNKGIFSIWLIKILIPRIDCLMVVNNHILENYRMLSITLPAHTFVSNVFIPPPLDEKEVIIGTYSSSFMAFLNNRSPRIMANAYQLKSVDGIDLYGLDMCIELTKRLKAHYPHVGFIFCLANENAEKIWYSQILTTLNEMNLTDNFFFLTGQKEIWPLYEQVQLFIRPTYRDGYGVSIDEALYFKCPAIASNACERNPQAIIFKNRNDDDLFEKCLSVLRKNSYG